MRPELESMLDGNDAALLIGDAALRASHDHDGWRPADGGTQGPRVLDLAREWNEMTRMPFVFAFWACRPVVRITEVTAALEAAITDGLAHLDEIATDESARTGLPRELIASYLRFNIRYRHGAAESDSLRFFFRICRDEGILGNQAMASATRSGSVRPGPADPAAARLS